MHVQRRRFGSGDVRQWAALRHKYVYDHGIARKEKMTIETGRGVLHIDLEVSGGKAQRVRVNMGEPILQSAKIPTTLPGDPPINVPLTADGITFKVTCVSMGNPHCVTFVDDHQEACTRTRANIETHTAFPQKTNVEFVKVNRRDDVNMRVGTG
jgi:diaminopimelate epimerase